jgi:hypothetical protein
MRVRGGRMEGKGNSENIYKRERERGRMTLGLSGSKAKRKFSASRSMRRTTSGGRFMLGWRDGSFPRGMCKGIGLKEGE